MLLTVICLGAAQAQAQPVIGLSAQIPPSAVPAGLPSSPLSSAAPGAAGSPADAAPFQWGPVQVRPHFSYQFTYGDGIQAQPGLPVKTAINAISPGVLFRIGDSLSVDYTATETLYSQRSLTDTLAHALSLSTGKGQQAGNWLLGFSQTFSVTSAPLVETASQTKQENATTGLSATRTLTRKLAAGLSLSQTARLAGSLGNTLEWATKDSLTYTLSSRLGLGVFVGGGYSEVSKAPNSTFSLYGGQANWKFSDKLSVALDSGLESRTSPAPVAQTTVTPTYTCSLNYKPFEFTTVSVTGTRSSTISLYENQVQDSENWRLGLTQRLLGKLTFTAGLQHQSGGFTSTTSLVAPSRADSGQVFNLGLGATIRNRGNVSISYQRSTNASNTTGYGFSSSQFGLTLAFKY